MRIRSVVVCSLLTLLAGCSSSTPNPDQSPQVSDEPTTSQSTEGTVNPKFTDELLAIAREYDEWERVDSNPRAAMLDCIAPSANEGLPRMSESDDDDGHGRKLYYLHARKKAAYLEVATTKQSDQAIVKQSWHAVETDVPEGTEFATVRVEGPDRSVVFATRSGDKYYFAGEQAPLFVMLQPKGATAEETDDGWVYGTVTSDGKTVTSCGLVQSCMKCHQDAPHGRLYGLKKSE